jgi:hypothetical protein
MSGIFILPYTTVTLSSNIELSTYCKQSVSQYIDQIALHLLFADSVSGNIRTYRILHNVSMINRTVFRRVLFPACTRNK